MTGTSAVADANTIAIAEESSVDSAKKMKEKLASKRKEASPRRYSPRALAPIRTLIPQFSKTSPKFRVNTNLSKPKQAPKLMRGRVLRSPQATVDDGK